MSIRGEVRRFILKNFLFSDDEAAIADADSLMQQGVVDSTGVLELIGHLEQTYGITIADEEMTPEHLDSVSAIAAFVERKQQALAG